MPPIPFPMPLYMPVGPPSSQPCTGCITKPKTPSYTPNASSYLPFSIQTRLIGWLPYLASCFQSTTHSCDFVHMAHCTITIKLGRIVEALGHCKCHIHWEL